MGKRSQSLGDVGERLARIALEQMGFDMVERIHVGYKLIRWIDARKRLARVAPVDRASGDFRAVVPGTGRSVLVEVKTRSQHDDRLLFSDLKQHQRAALSEHARAGGLSLLVWIAADGDWIDVDRDLYVLEWPVDGFVNRRPLSRERARMLDMKTRRFDHGEKIGQTSNGNN